MSKITREINKISARRTWCMTMKEKPEMMHNVKFLCHNIIHGRYEVFLLLKAVKGMKWVLNKYPKALWVEACENGFVSDKIAEMKELPFYEEAGTPPKTKQEVAELNSKRMKDEWSLFRRGNVSDLEKRCPTLYARHCLYWPGNVESDESALSGFKTPRKAEPVGDVGWEEEGIDETLIYTPPTQSTIKLSLKL